MHAGCGSIAGMNAPVRQGIPLRPDPSALRRATLRSLARAAIAVARGHYPGDAANLLREKWRDDHAAWAIVRASTAPSDTSSASALVRQTIPAFFEALGPASAGAQLLGKGLQLSFGDAGSISIPAFVVDASKIAFIPEGAPIPVEQLSVKPPVRSPRTSSPASSP